MLMPIIEQDKPLVTETAMSPNRLAEIKSEYSGATHQAAIAVYGFMCSEEFEKMMEAERKIAIDGIATNTIADVLNKAPFHTIHAGSEGHKEIQHTGKAAPSLMGKNGMEKHPEMEMVSDPVELTRAAANREPGALSIVAVTPPKGILRTTGTNSHYLIKLIAPAKGKGIMSLKQDHTDNLYNLSQQYGVPMKKIVQVMMAPTFRRSINQKYFDAAAKVGATIKLINEGDLVPGIKAVDPNRSEDEIYIYVGRGGREEGIITAVFAKALGGFMQAIEYNENPEIFKNNPLLTLDDLVPAERNSIFASGSFITDDPWFGQKGVRKNKNGIHTVTTITASHNEGLRFTDRISSY